MAAFCKIVPGVMISSNAGTCCGKRHSKCVSCSWSVVQLQEILLDFPWDHNILNLPGCQSVMADDNLHQVFAGPRVSMGIYKGTPSRVEPHG